MRSSADAALEQLDAALDALAALDTKALADTELAGLTVAVHARQARLDAEVTRVVGALDATGYAQGALGTPAWLAWKCRIRKSEARATVTRARGLRHMPEVAEAFASGTITADHVRLLTAAQRSNPKAFAKAEAELVDDAATLRFDVFARRVAYFRQLADPDGVEDEAQDAFARRHLHCSRTFEDTVQLDALLDPVGGSIVKNELDRLERTCFESDWAEARARLGDGATATAADLARSPEQRRADAMVEMARRSSAMAPGSKPARPLLTVLVGYETFAGRMCQLADGTVVTPGQVASLLADADIERVVFDGPSRIIDVGAKQRLFTGATRRAVEVRDLTCTVDGCDVAYDRCEVDHVRRWEHGGPTVQGNGRLRCPKHHRQDRP